MRHFEKPPWYVVVPATVLLAGITSSLFIGPSPTVKMLGQAVIVIAVVCLIPGFGWYIWQQSRVADPELRLGPRAAVQRALYRKNYRRFFDSYKPAAQSLLGILKQLAGDLSRSAVADREYTLVVQEAAIDPLARQLSLFSNMIRGIDPANRREARNKVVDSVRAYLVARRMLPTLLRRVAPNSYQGRQEEWMRLDADMFQGLDQLAVALRYPHLKRDMDVADQGAEIRQQIERISAGKPLPSRGSSA
jgi:hypothetical protein